MRFKEFLAEMAAPAEQHLSSVYYHGTDEAGAQGIMQRGIEAGDIILPTSKKSRCPSLEPVPGKVYITPKIGYAQVYAIGGDMAGSNYRSTAGQSTHGYVFVIKGSQLKDIQPDEDSIGEMIWRQLYEPKDNRFLKTYAYMAQQILTPKQFLKLKDGEYVMYAHVGKKLLAKMSDADKLEFINLGAHIAHTGNLQPDETWKIDLSKMREMKRDGSNFFELAEKVK